VAPGEQTDAELVRLAQEGDLDAFAEIVRRHEHRLRMVLLRVLPDARDVEEAVQDSFVQAWRNLGRFRGEAALFTWLYRIGLNAALARTVLTTLAGESIVPRQASKSGAPALAMNSSRLLSAAIGGYLLGTLPFADLAAKLATGGSVDIRSSGSGNPGGTNARRVLGRRWGLAVTAADVGKGIVACGWGRRSAGDLGAHVAGVAAVAGHCYPLWTRRRGGKGVATSFGQCLYTFPAYAPLDAAIATAVARVPGIRRPAFVSVAVSSTAWLLAGVLWWKRGLPNLWGPRPTAALPLANAATVLVIASRAVLLLRRGEPDELALPR
jgi:glycerol-3-phosphate acyltransferase PlsY